MQTQQNGSASGTGSTPANTVRNDFAALGQALQSGDIGQAQTAFTQMQKDFQAARQAAFSTAPAAQDQYVPASSQQQPLSITQQVQQDYAQLNSSLQSGDLSGAQSAFASLQQALQSQGAQGTATPANQSPTNSGADTITNDFNALGSALSSGNLTQAQGAFSTLQNDIQTAQQAAGSAGQSLTQGLTQMVKGHHHHHHHGGGGSSTESSTSTADSTNSSSTGLVATNSSSGVSLYA